MAKGSDGVWYKQLYWSGVVFWAECLVHSYAWTGSIPCTGDRRCSLCGKPETEHIPALKRDGGIKGGGSHE